MELYYNSNPYYESGFRKLLPQNEQISGETKVKSLSARSVRLCVDSTMAEAVLQTQDSFNCPICLDLLKDPVAIPCGHSFCLGCIKDCWDRDDQTGVYSCPQCRHTFTPRPVLNKNTMLAELAEGLRKTRLQAAPPAGSPAGSGDVECDVCTGTKHRAVKSCLVCLLSFCEAHIQPHYEAPAYKKHKLVEASMNLQEKICSLHDKLLEIFCRTDQQFICYLCVMDEHSGHKTVSTAAERSEKQKQLVENQRTYQQRIQQTENTLQELKRNMKTIRSSAQAAVEDSEKIFTELIQSIERRRSEVKELIRDQEKTELSHAEELLKKLEQEIADLRRRDAELEELSHTEDPIHFLQSFQSLSAPPPSADLPRITVSTQFSMEELKKAVTGIKEQVELNVVSTVIEGLIPKTREDLLKYSYQLSLDPNTAHSQLALSERNRKVTVMHHSQAHPDHPERFDRLQQVLCRESLTGRCYWEVEFSRNDVEIAVSYKDISRKGGCSESRFGSNDQSWNLIRSGSSFSFRHNNIQTKLPVKSSSSRIGVYVDHGAGILSFYSVSDTVTLLHRVHTTFTQPLYPGFGFYGYGIDLQISAICSSVALPVSESDEISLLIFSIFSFITRLFCCSTSRSAANLCTEKQLVENQRTFQQRIQQTENKLQELKQAMENLKSSAQAAVEDSEKIFTELIQSIERRRSEDPVTIPCGHSFCLGCIKDCWDRDDQTRVYRCPQCRHTFTPRPVLNKNTMLAELAEGLRKTRLQAAPPAGSPAGSGDVECDVCTGTKHRAVKSCLVCLASYCEAHIQTHYESAAFKKHKLVEASMNLQEKICSLHDKLLEIFCRTDQQFICYLCVMDEHSGHKTVSAAAERSEKQKQLVENQRTYQQRLQQTENTLQELKQNMETIRSSAQAAVEDSEKIFTELIQSIERRRSEVKELIRAQERTELSQAEELLKKLEQEIADLRRRDAGLEELSHTEDHIHFLQSFQSLSAPPPSADLPRITVSPQFSMEELKKAVTGIKEQVELNVVSTVIDALIPKTREDLLKYSSQLSLDPNTAHSQLALSERNRKVTLMHQTQTLPAHPERFDRVWQVLCRESLTGRCYWEVEFSRNTVNIAVSYKDISRKGGCNESGFGSTDQSWNLIRSSSSFYFRHNNEQTELPVKSSSSRIGVYVDHSAGIMSFYSVSDIVTLLHRVHTTFTQPLYPGFGVYVYDKVLQISAICSSVALPVSESDEISLLIFSIFSFITRLFCCSTSRSAANLCTEKQLVENQRTFQQRIQQTENKLQELKQAMENLKSSAQAAVEDSEKIFTELIQSIERRRSEWRNERKVSFSLLALFIFMFSTMAEAALQTQESFICPICLDLLGDPVTIPCGHSFCLGCIKDCWDWNDQRGVYSCPQCRHTFTPRPVLNKNTMLAELAEGLRKTRLQATPPAGSPAGSGDVECDVCTGIKHRAVKSCLVCLLSFCKAHIQPHYASPGYKNHKLVEASMNLQEKICSLHNKLLEIFCRTDQQFICYLCVMDEHSGHKTVSAAAERSEKQKQLVENQRRFQQRIQQTKKKLQQLEKTMETIRHSAQAAVEDSEKIFTELIQSIERRRSEVKELIRDQEKTELSQAEELLKKLEKEIADLRRRDAGLQELSHTEDHIHFLQSFQSLSAPPPSADLPRITVSPQFSMEELKKAMTGIKERVELNVVSTGRINRVKESFNCPVCLDLLRDPVTIPCGHSFCLGCIKDCWDRDDQTRVYRCPQCRHTFTPRPVLNKNTMLAELAEGLRRTRLQAAAPAGSPAGSGDVECDVCTGTKHRAVKSCLACLASYCEAHIQPHYESAAFKKHKLVEASMNLQEKICSLHDKLLEIFCRTDQQFICYLCVMDEHSGHKTVSAAAERSEKQKQLVENQKTYQQRLQQTENTLQELKRNMETIRSSAQAAVEDSEKIFTELIQSIERRRSEVKELIRAQEKTELSQAEELLKKLEQEIADLRRRDAELEELSHTEDPIHFLQSFQSLSAPPPSADLPRITISPQFSMEELKAAVTGIKEQVKSEIVRFSAGRRNIVKKQLVENQRTFQQRIQQTENKLQELKQAMENLK
ncbi:hypothetical protein NFI96_029419, partial [Prochilodus magdalenae]